jgi:hypothetical protein
MPSSEVSNETLGRETGGYTIEARIPATAIRGFQGKTGASWHIKLIYPNVNEIYQTSWEGIMTLRHAAERAR